MQFNTPSQARSIIVRAENLLSRFPLSITQLILRLTLALPFWRSGLTKWDGLHVADSAIYLFTEEFRLHIFGQEYAYPFPSLLAHLSAYGEIVLPVLLVLGLGTRFAALGILLMTAIIQLTIPDGWASYHLPWAAMALAIMTFGPGKIAVDQAIASWRSIRGS